jgi:hypothetical protein
VVKHGHKGKAKDVLDKRNMPDKLMPEDEVIKLWK